MEKTYVFIDSAYLSLISKHFGSGRYLNFDVNQFAIAIVKYKNLWCEGVFYYTAPPFQSSPPKEDEIKRRADYDKFIAKIKKAPNFTVREGRCQKIGNEYFQKGVDTLFTMDSRFAQPVKSKRQCPTIF